MSTTDMERVAARMRDAEFDLHQTRRILGTTEHALSVAREEVDAWRTITRYLEATQTGLSASPSGRMTITDQGGAVLYRAAGPVWLARAVMPALRAMDEQAARVRVAAFRRGTADAITGVRTL